MSAPEREEVMIMSKIAVMLADGFEEIEALTPVDILRRCGIEADTISINASEDVMGSHKIPVKADKKIADIKNWNEYDMIFLPGGKVGNDNLEACEDLKAPIYDFYKSGKWIAAICAAPSIFAHRGYLKGKNATSHPAFTSHLDEAGAITKGAPVEVCDHIVTGQGMGASIEFALTIAEIFAGKEMADRVAEGICYRK